MVAANVRRARLPSYNESFAHKILESTEELNDPVELNTLRSQPTTKVLVRRAFFNDILGTWETRQLACSP